MYVIAPEICDFKAECTKARDIPKADFGF